ncbi:DUF1772 domain-containing protein [Amycolatopsis sp. NPDC058986]|uniref:anthrone oxygenase family protein n=1 Tax=unclassified Amycolatopsis TaxID=2618356 RepID=UPI003670599B
MDTVAVIALVAATITAGLSAGLFYAYACSVMPGLARGDAKTFVEGMRGINVAILNGWFMATFLGAPLLAAVAGALHLRSDLRGALPWVVAGFVLLMVTLIVTGVVNVPLNNALEAQAADGSATLEEVRARFETVWVRWNVVRAVSSTAGFGCLVGALLTRR